MTLTHELIESMYEAYSHIHKHQAPAIRELCNLALVGLAVQPRPLSEIKPEEGPILGFKNDRFRRPDKSQDGGPAFPVRRAGFVDGGMSLHDWFAGQALAGMSGSGEWFADATILQATTNGVETEEYMALMAFALADAMIAARSKP